MPVDRLAERTAVVLIDLQKGITALPTVHPAADVVARAAQLAHAARISGAPLIRVRVAFSADGGDVVRARTDAPPPAVTPTPDFAEYDKRIPVEPGDILITKRGWDAFYGTELDLQLRRRQITGIVLAGISTSIGVESTARTGREHGYEIAVAADAVTDLVASAHDTSLRVILPRIARIDSTAAIVDVLARG
ncbi:isochorismatase family protein [Actinoplanes hulinensis]|uniref:Isochorismatase family protein n=1 Tax=Actinoplanes hulinensis TaxID=1144547 RepID=A0ABS7BHB1_9ACTN|nr:isochorismatase family protein [Actinoplanes hulinensis]MBW6440266.1 isochorismatase family protein [Actinoplanes hulinensis]